MSRDGMGVGGGGVRERKKGVSNLVFDAQSFSTVTPGRGRKKKRKKKE